MTPDQIIDALADEETTTGLISLIEYHQDEINEAVENGSRAHDVRAALIGAAERVSVYSLSGLILSGLRASINAETHARQRA